MFKVTRFAITAFSLLAATIFAVSSAFAAFTVQTVSGGVQVRTSATGAWANATVGMKLSSGASIKTAPDGSCVLKSANGNGVKVSKMTIVDIAKLESDGTKENTMLNLNSGRVLATVSKGSNKGSSFQVKTPTAVAGVRGTDFFAELSPEGDSKIGVTDGQIEVEVGGQEIVVDENLQLEVSDTGEITEPAPIPEDVKQEIQQETQGMKADMQLEVKSEESSTKEEKKEEKAESKESKEEAKAESKETKEEAKEESKEETSTQESKTEETAPEADDTSAADIASDSVNDVIDNQVINDTVDQATEAMDTGSVTVDIYLGQ